jgi:hypothetical protein
MVQGTRSTGQVYCRMWRFLFVFLLRMAVLAQLLLLLLIGSRYPHQLL